jgi:hypothetical protein
MVKCTTTEWRFSWYRVEELSLFRASGAASVYVAPTAAYPQNRCVYYQCVVHYRTRRSGEGCCFKKTLHVPGTLYHQLLPCCPDGTAAVNLLERGDLAMLKVAWWNHRLCQLACPQSERESSTSLRDVLCTVGRGLFKIILLVVFLCSDRRGRKPIVSSREDCTALAFLVSSFAAICCLCRLFILFSHQAEIVPLPIDPDEEEAKRRSLESNGQ